jgi:Fe-S cluster assembly ATP-binding protein
MPAAEFKTGCLVITHYRRILDHIKPDHVQIMALGHIIESGSQALVDRVEKEGYVPLRRQKNR